MNTFKIAFFGLLLTSVTAFSQYNNYNNNRYSGRGQGQGIDHSTPEKPSATETEKAKAQQVDKVVANLKEDLKLDELQVIAIKNEIASNMKNIDIIIKKETSDEDKSKEIKALSDRTEIVINSYLNAEQKEKYKVILAEIKSGKKARGKAEQSEAKDKKNKKKDKTTEE